MDSIWGINPQIKITIKLLEINTGEYLDKFWILKTLLKRTQKALHV
jgi:hypothetical protein